MELVGLPSSRNRAPTRDVRELFRDKARQMLLDCGVPNVIGGPTTRESTAATA
jgi:hypothetical protein